MSAPDLLEVVLPFNIADVSTAGQVFIPIPVGFDGTIVEIITVLNGAIATADVDLTAKIAGVAVTNGLITITQSGSAAGDVDIVNPTSNNAVAAGGTIEIETDGASTNTIEVFGMVRIRR